MAKQIPFLIGVSGPSCSGKTEISRRLAEIYQGNVVALDSYYKDLSHLTPEERALVNFDQPEALDVDLLLQQVRQLAAGEAIDKPIYDFKHHVRAKAVERVIPGRVVIVEGLFAFYWKALRDLFRFRIFMEAPDATCEKRREDRDVRERGRTPEYVREQYRTTVRPMVSRYVLPTREYADLVLDGEKPMERLVRAAVERINRVCGMSSTA